VQRCDVTAGTPGLNEQPAGTIHRPPVEVEGLALPRYEPR